MPRGTRLMSLNLRMSADELAPCERRAARLDISVSQATRELIALGAVLELGANGWAMSDGVQAIVARREPLVMTIAPDPDDPEGGPLWLVTPEEVAQHEASA